ncbi:MAG: hypothetical protein Q8Q01_01275 [archaeon]|nr:hypothetical protein [archaeon]
MDKKYSRLERQIRKIAPASKYGYLGYLLSPDHGIKIVDGVDLFIDGKFSFDLGYDCIDVNRRLYKLLHDNGINARFQLGIDSRSIFKQHYFCRNDQNVVVDGTPLFSFYGEEHFSDMDLSINRPEFLSRDIRSFLIISSIDGRDYILQIDTKKNFLVKGFLCFTFEANFLDSRSGLTESIEVNLRKYRKDVASNDSRYLKETCPEIKSKRVKYLEPSIEITSAKKERPLLERVIRDYHSAVNAFVHKMAYSSEE